MKRAVLLLNLGTPASPEPRDVRRYLNEFLMDPYVIDIPWIARALLVKGIILNTRPKKSAAAYAKVWTERGSPLLFHTLDLAERVQALVGPEIPVIPGMRYGNPSVDSGIRQAISTGAEELIVFPLYPQYSLAASESSIAWTRTEAERLGYRGTLTFIPPFYDDAGFIAAFAEKLRVSLAEFPADVVIFSFHGLPERHLEKVDTAKTICLRAENCCDSITAENANCYRAQCFQTARSLAAAVGISKDQYQVTFQSRLGRTPWIKPYTDFVLPALAHAGRARRVLVASPSFVADCLETLEEIAIRLREDFIAAGGEDLRLVPSLNSDARWAEAVVKLLGV